MKLKFNQILAIIRPDIKPEKYYDLKRKKTYKNPNKEGGHKMHLKSMAPEAFKDISKIMEHFSENPHLLLD